MQLVKNDIDGVIILDKPKGITSNRALQRVKRIFNAKKAGHTGSLDPIATGILPICFGKSTKLSNLLLNADKSYIVTARLGIRTDTMDADGKIIASDVVPELSLQDIENYLMQFVGDIEQIPPMYSALKYHGKPLYKLARQGIEVELKPRLVKIYSIKLIAFSNEQVHFEVSCSKGTYIRTLVDDLGLKIGCGAHVVDLRRVSLGPYVITDAVTFDQLSISLIL